jgi:signal transduction histidine kinase
MAWAIFRYKMLDVIPVAWATVLEAADTGIMVLDLGNRVLDVNPAFARKIGTEAPALAQEVAVVCGSIPELLDLCIKQTAIQVEFPRCINGQIKVFEARRSPLTDKKGSLIGHLVLIYDITEKKQAQKEYLCKQREIVSIEERERLARDLHDNLAQVLGFINFQTAGIRQELLNADITMVEPELNKLVAVTQKTHEEIREYIRQTRNTVKIDKDFLTELSCEITAFEEQSGIQVDLDISCELTEETFRYPVCMHILQIIKEALNNIRKHAVAKKAKISLVIQQEQLRVTIEDDGKGFDCVDCEQIAQGNSTGFGLKIMEERAEAIGAQLRITSVLGKGTRVVLIMPTAERGINHDVESDAG